MQIFRGSAKLLACKANFVVSRLYKVFRGQLHQHIDTTQNIVTIPEMKQTFLQGIRITHLLFWTVKT